MTDEYEITLKKEMRSVINKVLNHVISPAVNQSIVTARDGESAVYNFETEEIKNLFEKNFGDIWGGALSFNGTNAITIAAPFRYSSQNLSRWNIGLWDVYQERLNYTIEIDEYNYRSAASTDLSVVMIANSREINWWNVEQEKRLGAVKHNHSDQILMVAVSSKGDVAASLSLQEVFLWDVQSGAKLRTISVPKKKFLKKATQFSSMRFGMDHIYLSTNESKFFVADFSGSMFEMIIDTDQKAWTYNFDIHEKSNLAAINVYEQPLELWDIFSGKMVGSVETAQGKEITDIRFSDDAQILVTADRQGVVKIWKVDKK